MSGQNAVTPSAEGIAASIRAAKTRGLPPVHLWDPAFSGELDMRIARDGIWHYLGSPITRPALVRLFSTILKKEGGEYYLVTPAEKVRITVEDAPFVAMDFEVEGRGPAQELTFTTTVGDSATAGPGHSIRATRDPATGEPAPYVAIRDGLEALIDRKSFYRMAEIGTHRAGWFGVWSCGEFFALIRSDELEGI